MLHWGNVRILLQLISEIEKKKKKREIVTPKTSEDFAIVKITTIYFVLVDAPYPNDGVSSSSEEPIESRVQLQRIHPIPVVLFHLISNDIGHLE